MLDKLNAGQLFVPREVAVHELVATRLAQIEALCRALGVRRLDLFGSAAQRRT